MDSRSAAIAPPFVSGADSALDHPASRPQASAPSRERRLFTITDLRVHHPDLGVHDADLGVHLAPIFAFTFDRSGRSAWTEARTLIPDTVLPIYSCDVWSSVLPASPPDARARGVPVVGTAVSTPWSRGRVD
jgi:hypothetical protein